ncbi:hypothetical protein Smp_180440 [Schistosoma mansoni]|uniref:hypothetical protein n=1 Tax=Schistosoma mansoni TaxID=6183 RepID=UPI0001A6290D|nr:hypothetical protein Smp_180440 [Schistosoma mansoni]|eukprot:XP_018650251.1 hypothetical protein Smp_180440 [Schistosoma mansoni]
MASSEDSGYVLQNEVVCIETKSVEPVLCKPRLLPLKSVKLSGYEVEDEIKDFSALTINPTAKQFVASESFIKQNTSVIKSQSNIL